MSEEGKALAEKAREIAGSMQAKMVPGLSGFLRQLAAWVESIEGKKQ